MTIPSDNLAGYLAERYGKPRSSKPNRRFVIALASVLTGGFLAWAAWVAIDGADQIKTKDLGYEIIDENQVSVRFSVETPAGPAICAIQVLNQGYAVVGYREVSVPASGEFETPVNTTQLGVTGLVDKCRLIGPSEIN